MRKLIVASPCICRREIHDVCFAVLLEYLKPVAENTTFVVNIDPCHGTNNETQEETEANLKRMFDERGVKYEIYRGDAGCFFTATKKILTRVDALLGTPEYSDANVFWFEDDKLIRKDPYFKGYLELPFGQDFVSHFWRKAPGSPSFHPCLWSANMAKKYLIHSIVNETATYDPELLMMTHWKKHYKGEAPLRHYITFSKDIGREWAARNNIKKWVREAMRNKPVTYI